MRIPFSEAFYDSGDGSYTPKQTIKIGGITMTPGVTFTSGVSFSGVNIAQYVGRDLDVEKHPDGTIEIKGIF